MRIASGIIAVVISLLLLPSAMNDFDFDFEDDLTEKAEGAEEDADFITLPPPKYGRFWELVPYMLLTAAILVPAYWEIWYLSFPFAGALAFFAWRMWQDPSPQVAGLKWIGKDQFAIRFWGEEEDMETHGQLMPNAFVHPRLLALRFKTEDGVVRVIYPVAREHLQALRPLRVILLHQVKQDKGSTKIYA